MPLKRLFEISRDSKFGGSFPEILPERPPLRCSLPVSTPGERLRDLSDFMVDSDDGIWPSKTHKCKSSFSSDCNCDMSDGIPFLGFCSTPGQIFKVFKDRNCKI